MQGPRRHLHTLVIACFIGALCLPVVSGIPALLGSGDAISAQEKRRLHPWPDAPTTVRALRRWPGEFNLWFDDRFGLRDGLIAIHNYGKAALGISPSQRAILGDDGWVFIENTHLTDANRGARPFARGEAERLAALFVSAQQRLAQRGVAYVHLTPPDKQSLFREYLPARIRILGPSRYAQWRSAALDSALNFVDLYPVLERSIAAGETPYMRTDSHWNCYGAYLAYREIMDAINQETEVALPVLEETDVTFDRAIDPVGGDLVRNFLGTPFLFPEPYAMRCPIVSPARLSYTALEDGSALRLRDTHNATRPSRVMNHDFPDGPRALVLRDSYTNAMIPFLSHSFREVIYMTYDVRPPEERLIDELQPNIVIYEHVERSLVRYSKVIADAGLPASEVRRVGGRL